MPKRPQCPVYAPTTSIQCVMEEGHEPFGGTLIHNFGGLGPYPAEVGEFRAGPTVGRVQRWVYDGVVLNTDDKGFISLEDLKEFVTCVERLDAKSQKEISVHPYGLRASRLAGEGGPHLDWRD